MTPPCPQQLWVPQGSALLLISHLDKSFLSSHLLQRETRAAALSWHRAADSSLELKQWPGPAHDPAPLAASPNLVWSWKPSNVSSSHPPALALYVQLSSVHLTSPHPGAPNPSVTLMVPPAAHPPLSFPFYFNDREIFI